MGYGSRYEYAEDGPFVRTDLIQNLERRTSDTVPHMDQVPDIDDVPAVTIMPTDEDELDLQEEDGPEVDGDDYSGERP